jgi:hypothetical protein
LDKLHPDKLRKDSPIDRDADASRSASARATAKLDPAMTPTAGQSLAIRMSSGFGIELLQATPSRSKPCAPTPARFLSFRAATRTLAAHFAGPIRKRFVHMQQICWRFSEIRATLCLEAQESLGWDGSDILPTSVAQEMTWFRDPWSQ